MSSDHAERSIGGFIEIHSGPLSMFGAKAEMAAIEKGIAWKRVFVPFSIATLYQPNSTEVLRINPKKQVPVLIDGDLELFDSTQIFEYLEELQPTPALWPSDPRDRARARLMELKSDEVFFPHVVNCMPNRQKTLSENDIRESVDQIHSYFSEIDARLGDREYLCGAFGYADIAFYAAQFFARFLQQAPSEDLHHLQRWREQMVGRESVQTVMGEMVKYLAANGLSATL